ncbi:10805_t:CDS:2 [Rhizophagus irregularis]|nr:10805_t:CDS:2 [Rhizophagus irregularis]
METLALPVECLTIIFENLSYEKLGVKNYSFTILHSCILVNKIWCATAIPILWRNPWNWLIEGLYLNRLTLLTATFISCLPKEIKNMITKNHIKMKKWMKNGTSFDYPYFMNGLDYSWLYFSINIFLKENFKIRKEIFKNEYKTILLKELCKLFMKRRATQTLYNLKKFYITGWIPSEIIFGISKICKNIEEIRINNFHIDDDEEIIITLIQEQKFLKKFSFEIKFEDKFIEFSFLRFEKILKSKSKNLELLKLSPICFCMDTFIEYIDINFISFKQISSLIRNTNHNLEIITIIWLEGIDEIEYYKIFIETIIFNCPNLKEFYGKFDYNYIPLLCKNCIHLKKLQFKDFNILDFSKILKQIGDVIPINLSKFYLPLCWNFNSDSLEYFLKKCLIRLNNPLYFNIYEGEKHEKIIKSFKELNVLVKKDDILYTAIFTNAAPLNTVPQNPSSSLTARSALNLNSDASAIYHAKKRRGIIIPELDLSDSDTIRPKIIKNRMIKRNPINYNAANHSTKDAVSQEKRAQDKKRAQKKERRSIVWKVDENILFKRNEK